MNDVTMLLLRLVHILLGVYWAGTLMFFATLLEPSVREAGPDGARVMAALQRRGYLTYMPAIALFTILSGLWLFYRVSGRMDPEWLHSATGMSLSTGALAAIVAFIIGVFVMRPTALRAMAMARAAQEVDGAEREARMAAIAPLRRRVTLATRWVGALLAVAVTTMAVARYL